MRPLRHLTYANVASTLALVLVLGGGGAAVAAGLAKNSVGTAQLKKNAVVSVKVKNNSLTGADVRNNSLSGSDIKLGSLNRARASVGVNGSVAPLTSTSAEVASATLKAPANGYVLVSAESIFKAGQANTYIDVKLKQDGVLVNPTEWLWDAGDADGNYDQTQNYSILIPVTKGVHTYSLWLYEAGATTFSNYAYPHVLVQFFPEGSIATSPLPRQSRKIN